MIITEVLKNDPQSPHEIDDILEEKGIDSEEFLEYCGRERSFLHNLNHSRKLCWTRNGYLGLAPMSAKVGDIICVFAGGRVPYVIRETQDGSIYFNFIGDCYVHGMMHGEVVASESSTWKEIGLL